MTCSIFHQHALPPWTIELIPIDTLSERIKGKGEGGVTCERYLVRLGASFEENLHHSLVAIKGGPVQRGLREILQTILIRAFDPFTMTPNLETQNWSEKKYVFFTKCWDTFIVFYLFSVRCVIWFSYLIRVAAAISGLCYPSGIFGFAPLSRSIRKIRDHCIQCMQWSLAKYLCGHFLQPQTRVRIKGNTADNCYPRS